MSRFRFPEDYITYLNGMPTPAGSDTPLPDNLFHPSPEQCLEMLKERTGQDFGYDQHKWIDWFRREEAERRQRQREQERERRQAGGKEAGKNEEEVPEMPPRADSTRREAGRRGSGRRGDPEDPASYPWYRDLIGGMRYRDVFGGLRGGVCLLLVLTTWPALWVALRLYGPLASLAAGVLIVTAYNFVRPRRQGPPGFDPPWMTALDSLVLFPAAAVTILSALLLLVR